MSKLFRKTFEWGNNFSTVWGLLPAAWQTFVTAGFATVTAYFGFHEVGWARAIFYSSGVLAFGMTTVFLSLRIAQITGIFQRMSIASFGISSVSTTKNNHDISGINFIATLRNDSQQPMFYRLKRMHAVINRQAQVGTAIDNSIIIIPAFGGLQPISFATIQNVPIPKNGIVPDGHLEIEVDYGPSATELDYMLRQVVDVQLAVSKMPGSVQSQVHLNTQVKVLEHSRNPK